MRSAYLVLGVPGNATAEEIETAFRKSEKQFTRERLAEEDGALARFTDLKTAYQVLRDAESRAAHDRKLQGSTPRSGARPRTVIVQASEPSILGRWLVPGVLLLALVFGSAATLSWHNAQVRKEQAALELAAQKTAAEEAARKREQDERLEKLRADQAAQASANERRLSAESQVSAARAMYNQRAQETNVVSARRLELQEQQRRESARLDEERRATYEARMRTERDKARVRELCWQQYHRSDC